MIFPREPDWASGQATSYPSSWTLRRGGGYLVGGKTYWALSYMRQILNRKYGKFSWAEQNSYWALQTVPSEKGQVSWGLFLLFCFSSLWRSLVKPPCCLKTKVNLGWSHSNIQWSRLDQYARSTSHKPGLSHTALTGAPVPVAWESPSLLVAFPVGSAITRGIGQALPQTVLIGMQPPAQSMAMGVTVAVIWGSNPFVHDCLSLYMF